MRSQRRTIHDVVDLSIRKILKWSMGTSQTGSVPFPPPLNCVALWAQDFEDMSKESKDEVTLDWDCWCLKFARSAEANL